MKQKELSDEGPITMSYASYDNDEVNSKCLEDNEHSITNEILSKPKTMKNNCVNLKCMDNVQKLWSLREKYKELEEKYDKLEKETTKRCGDFEDLLAKKEIEYENYKKLKSIYIEQNVSELNYYQLKNLEAQILRSLSIIKNEKDKALQAATKTGLFSKKTCVVCYECEIKILFKPCLHLCVCEKCSPKFDTCPMCREQIRERERVKYSYTY
jgi:hypothetical protein